MIWDAEIKSRKCAVSVISVKYKLLLLLANRKEVQTSHSEKGRLTKQRGM